MYKCDVKYCFLALSFIKVKVKVGELCNVRVDLVFNYPKSDTVFNYPKSDLVFNCQNTSGIAKTEVWGSKWGL